MGAHALPPPGPGGRKALVRKKNQLVDEHTRSTYLERDNLLDSRVLFLDRSQAA
jgi:hypothetical protein